MEEITDITDQLEMLEEVSEYADNTAATATLKIERNVNPVKKMQIPENMDTSADSGTYISRSGGGGNTSSDNKDMLTDVSQSGGDNDDFSSGDEEPPPLMIVPEISLGGADDFFSQEVEITEECVELIKDKMSPFDYKCALCEFSTSQVSGRIYYIRRRSGNIYFPCEMCQFVKITLQTATAAYMSSHTKKVNRNGDETLVMPASHDMKRVDLINYTRKAATEFVAKYHLGNGMKNSKSSATAAANNTSSFNHSASLSPAPSSPAVVSLGGGMLGAAGYDSPASQASSGAGYPSPWDGVPENAQSPHVDMNSRSGVDRKYTCDFCPYNTTTFYRLQQHVQKDHNIERHVCPQVKCTFEASDENALKEHVLNVHEGSRFPCHLCSFLATRKATLKTHIESIHEGVKYPCEQCGYAATQMSALRRHIRSQHGIDGKDARNNKRPYMLSTLLPK